MAVFSSDLKYYLTGASVDGGAQGSIAASLGNFRSSTEIIDSLLNNILDDLTSAQRVSGYSDYKCICVRNEHATDTMVNALVWIETAFASPDFIDVLFAVEVPNGGDLTGNAQTIANEITPPVTGSGNVGLFGSPNSKLYGESIDKGAHDANLDAGEIIFLWLWRNALSGVESGIGEHTIMIEGDI